EFGERAVELAPGMPLNSKYELIEQIGRGGMGVVWKAHDIVGDRSVALKFVPPDLQRFESEMQRVRETFGKVHALNHQSICPLYGMENGGAQIGHYLVMKYLKGETLHEYIVRTDRKRKGFPLSQVAVLLTRVAKALDYAHRYDVIHRDIKPSNIFLVNTGKGVEVQVIDFGLADEIKSSLTRVSQLTFNISGTRPYMAPEQWRGRRQTAATDQYALGVVAYELLAGYLPFDVKDTELLRLAVMQDTPERIKKIPDAANAALQKAMAKDKEDRFESCVAFVKALIDAGVVKPDENTVRKEEHVAEPEEYELTKDDFFELPDMEEKKSSDAFPDETTPVTPSITSLMKRGQLFLEDSDWQQANEYFDRVLDIDPEYAPAYIGKLCAELKLRNEEQLGDHETPISEFNNYNKALRFADDEYRATAVRYNEKIRERLRQEQERREELKRQEQERKRLERERRVEQARIERERQEEQERLDQYERLREEAKKASTEKDFQSLAQQFRTMNGYKDTVEFADECEKKYRSLKDRREEKEHQELLQVGRRAVLAIKEVEYHFRYCPAGMFLMGSPASEKERRSNETQHQVTLSRGFWMLETPVTQEMWESVMGDNPSDLKGERYPVECVSWDDCQEYIQKLNDMDIVPKSYRFSLPTEAQWEYACRAGTTTPFHFGDALNGDKANCHGFHPYGPWLKGWTTGRYYRRTTKVRSYPPNDWGLYDMHGNVWEWCLDLYGTYPVGDVTDPVGASNDSRRVRRGGGWFTYAGDCRSAYRDYLKPSDRANFIGFRIVLVRVDDDSVFHDIYTAHLIIKVNAAKEERERQKEERERQRIAEEMIAKMKMKIDVVGYHTFFGNIFDAAEKGTVQDVAYFIKKGVDCN
ncbi:MAG: SUMF1/EgtB/PvdO family nonheme iron enzyme, partial [Planctomycetaceae bacterium]|nr:SUMF1/EgtB/PvdO family nonheme iron enzyme [Planctomycetaceae bacterium]